MRSKNLSRVYLFFISCFICAYTVASCATFSVGDRLEKRIRNTIAAAKGAMNSSNLLTVAVYASVCERIHEWKSETRCKQPKIIIAYLRRNKNGEGGCLVVHWLEDIPSVDVIVITDLRDDQRAYLHVSKEDMYFNIRQSSHSVMFSAIFRWKCDKDMPTMFQRRDFDDVFISLGHQKKNRNEKSILIDWVPCVLVPES